MSFAHKPMPTQGMLILLKKVSEKVAAFKGLSLDEIAQVFQFAEKKTFNPCEPIVIEGKVGTCMYILLDGEAVVAKQIHVGKYVEIRRLGPADSFGEMSVIDNEPRSASVMAATPCTLLRLSSQALLVSPEIGVRIFRNLARGVVQKLRELEAQMPAKAVEPALESKNLPEEASSSPDAENAGE